MYGETVYVAFCNDDGHWWSRFLHPSIRHCYVVKPDTGRWITFSRCARSYDLYIHADFTINDIIVVKCQQKNCKRSLFMLNTCVGHAKQILGINAWWVFTPYQLYRYLERHNEVTKST